MSETSTLISCTGTITRAELAQVPTPPSTATHVPIPHAAVVEALVGTLSHRQISVVAEEFAVSKDGMEMFGVLDLPTGFEGCRYQAFIEEESGFPKHLARRVHDLYFEPVHEEFQPRTMWSLSNAFTSAFKELEPIPQYKATAKLAGFLQSVRPQ